MLVQRERDNKDNEMTLWIRNIMQVLSFFISSSGSIQIQLNNFHNSDKKPIWKVTNKAITYKGLLSKTTIAVGHFVVKVVQT